MTIENKVAFAVLRLMTSSQTRSVPDRQSRHRAEVRRGGHGRPEVGNPADGAPAPFDACLSARDRIHHRTAEDAEWQDPAFHSARRGVNSSATTVVA